MVARTFIFNVTAPTVGAPSWYASQTEKTWKAVAAPTATTGGNRLQDVAATLPVNQGGAAYVTNRGVIADITGAWTGGCVDQQRGDLLFAANGGHANYDGNEVYGCRIRSETPTWYRLTDPSPFQYVTQSFANGTCTSNSPAGQAGVPGGARAKFAKMNQDGRMCAQHGWQTQVYHNGAVWFGNQASPSGVGDTTGHAWKFDRSFAGIPAGPGSAALAHNGGAGPWSWLGNGYNGNKGLTVGCPVESGTAPPWALDPVTGLVWALGGDGNLNCHHWTSLDTSSGAIQSYGVSGDLGNRLFFDGGWSCVVYDPAWDRVNPATCRWRFLVIPSVNTQELLVLDLKNNPTGIAGWSFVTVSNYATLVPRDPRDGVSPYAGFGAAYHAPSRSILLCDPAYQPTAPGANDRPPIIKLRVPTNPDGTYAGGTWQVSTISTTGGDNPYTGTTANGGGNGSDKAWSKFNIIEDMSGGGNPARPAALVVCMGVGLPTYVYKLPTTEIF